MAHRNQLLFAVVIALIFAASTASALGSGGHNRDGMVIALTMGHGWSSIDINDDQSNGDVSTFVPAFKIGWARSDNLVGYIGISGWKRSNYYSYAPSSVSNFNFVAEIYWFPTAQGFWLKGGAGTGSIDVDVSTIDPTKRISIQEGGFTYTLGAGIEYRTSDTFAFGINYDYTNVDIGDLDFVTGVSATNHVLGISLNWYQE